MIKEVDAKKQKINIVRAPKHVIKPGNNLITLVEGGREAPAGRSAAPSSPSPVKKRPVGSAAASVRSSGLGIKVKPTGGAKGDTPASSQLDGDLSNDPIAQSLSVRIKLGGLSNNCTEVDAKKNQYPIFRSVKHPAIKGGALQDIGAPPKAAAEAPEASPVKRGLKPPSKGLKPPTKVAGSASKSAASLRKSVKDGVDLGPAVSPDEDPIAASLRARVAAGGHNSQIREADAKKQKIFIPRALNLKSAG